LHNKYENQSSDAIFRGDTSQFDPPICFSVIQVVISQKDPSPKFCMTSFQLRVQSAVASFVTHELTR